MSNESKTAGFCRDRSYRSGGRRACPETARRGQDRPGRWFAARTKVPHGQSRAARWRALKWLTRPHSLRHLPMPRQSLCCCRQSSRRRGFPEANAMIAALKTALAAARPQRIVVLSTIGAQAEQINLLTQLQVMEQSLGALSISDRVSAGGVVHGERSMGCGIGTK